MGGKGASKGGGQGYGKPGSGGGRRCDGDDNSDDEDLESEGVEDSQLFGSQASAEAGDSKAMSEMGDSLTRSPFGPETFPTAKACWDHAAEAHSFSLARLRADVGTAWTDYHRIRLVNYLRSIGPEAAKLAASKLSKESPIWEDDTLLQPVLEDDMLLFEDDDEEAFSGGGTGLDDRGPDNDEDSKLASLQELARLRAENEELRRLLSAANGADCELERSRALAWDAGLAEALAAPGLVEGKNVLDASCGAAVLCCLCVRHGARQVSVLHPAPAARAMLATNAPGVQLEPCGPCDVLLSERLLGHLRLGPALPQLLAERARWLRPGGRVLPSRLLLRLSAADCSAELQHGGLDLAALAPLEAAEPDLASARPAELLALDMATAAPEEALPSRAPFVLELLPESCATSLAVHVEAESPLRKGPFQLLHLHDAGKLHGAEIAELAGWFSATWESGRLLLSAELVARRKDGGELRASASLSAA